MQKHSKNFAGGITMKNTNVDVIKPYKGEDKYIFISYAHKDYDRIKEIITDMYKKGYRIWFDEGIDPGTEWDENIAEHIEKSECVLAFISENYLRSENCKDELNYARELQKERLLVYMDDVSLPSGMAMRMNRLQAIHQYKYKKIDLFYDKLYDVGMLCPCCEQGVGTVFADRYKILEIHKNYGSSEVYKALDLKTEEIVTLKKYSVITAFNSLLFSKRGFANALKNLNTPRVCQLIDVVAGTEPYAVMQYIEGETLGSYVFRNAPDEKQILRLMKQVLEALDVIHKQEMLYVDVSPYNIIVNNGEICLIDLDSMTFDGSKFDLIVTSITRYNCPERYADNNMDYRSDIYATGMLLNDLTLRRDDVGCNVWQLVGDKDLSDVKYDDCLKQGIMEIIFKATRKNPQDRYQSAAEMINDIDRLLA